MNTTVLADGGIAYAHVGPITLRAYRFERRQLLAFLRAPHFVPGHAAHARYAAIYVVGWGCA